MNDNPYFINSPVTGSQFFGQEELLTSIIQTIVSSFQNAVTIYGQERSGKTSILQEVAHRLRVQSYIPVYWSLDGQGALPLVETLQKLADTIVDKTDPSNLASQTLIHPEVFQNRFLPAIESEISPKRLFLLLDDIDSLLPSGEEANKLIVYLQKLIINKPDIAFALTTSKKFQELPSYFQRIGKQVRYQEIQPLTSAETRELIVTPVKDRSIGYTPEAVNLISDLAAGPAIPNLNWVLT